jgi:hypothetical protein
VTTLKHSFENFADGATIDTTGGGGGDTAFNTATTGTDASAVATTDALIGSKAMKIATGATAAQVDRRWDTSFGTQNVGGDFRIYAKLSGSPPATTRCYAWSSSGGNSFFLAWTASRTVRLLDGAAGTVGESTTVLAVGTWYRIEGHVVLGVGGTGTLTVSIHRWDETAALETIIAPGSYGTPATRFKHGVFNNVANLPYYLLDGIAISDSGPIGPEPGYVNDPPTLSLGGSTAVDYGDSATVTATAADPQGGAITYAWAFDSKPSGSSNDISGDTDDSVSFTPDRVGSYVVRCTVTKTTGGKTATTTRTVTVSPRLTVRVGGVNRLATASVKVAGQVIGAQISVKTP